MAIESSRLRCVSRKRTSDETHHFNAGELSELDFDRYGFFKKALILAAYVPLLALAGLARLFGR